MLIQVVCRCRVRRTIDTREVGAWRLRCKQCGDVLYDPATAPAEPAPEAEDEEDDTQFQRWLEGSGELKLLLSSEGDEAPPCPRHPSRRVVAACTRCAALLCKHCLDRIDDQFACAACVAEVAARVDPAQGGLFAWFRRLLGGG